MPDLGKITVIVAAGLGAFALLLLIISVGTVLWLDDGNGNSIGLFRNCTSSSYIDGSVTYEAGCRGANRITQGGLSVFGLLLLVAGVIVAIATLRVDRIIVLLIALGLFYFSSMFVMAAYATWGTYARDPALYLFPRILPTTSFNYTSMGSSYHLCVASHYFLWTALTILAFGVGYAYKANEAATG